MGDRTSGESHMKKLEEATIEELKARIDEINISKRPKVGTFWLMEEDDADIIIRKVIADAHKECNSLNSRPLPLVCIEEDGYVRNHTSEDLVGNWTQVSNWDGDPIEEKG